MDSSSWADQRRENARARAALLRAEQEQEYAAGRALLARFVEAAREGGPAPEPLFVTHPGNGARARTPLRGWYLRDNRSMGVDVDGNFYLLTAPLTLLERLRGVRPEPGDPPLILGKGGRDGETIDLVDALTRVWPDWQKQTRG